MKNYSLIAVLTLCLGLTACGPDIFYIPIDNKLGSAQPLSKTEDTIRVIVPERITQYVAKARSDDSDWSKATDTTLYIGLAKIKTDDVLTEQGYKLVGAGVNGGAEGHPNVIAMVDSGVLKTYDKTYTWQVPISTDPITGQPNMWDTQGQTVTMNLIYYKIKIVRPIGKDNLLFTCNNSSLTANLCVYSQDNPSTYETIFEGYGTMDTNARDPAYIEDHLASSVLYQYPTLLGKKRVYQISQIYPQVTKVTDAPDDQK
ncbi:hypothetical protein [Commensalibacter papalotli (ex Botero et al. 2024)]|uniref:Uncharacterized protein n=1 Tax=Commensalibacter papalotli (ex Botero et al. 2024) TaxID=2972766 RepID=A0ABM9HU70_9PROT|nr:hypothetical protein [Commensalibacter papalotli (ex Botero et al. 2024)]CAI3954901.1 unnamed protein product [Commensalibacter papalotli (ex Botero et al. 2024)]CAI3955385.1 unnamed protein product [Commensalibacter papalotli (ex Botero et al. 2024)]